MFFVAACCGMYNYSPLPPVKGGYIGMWNVSLFMSLCFFPDDVFLTTSSFCNQTWYWMVHHSDRLFMYCIFFSFFFFFFFFLCWMHHSDRLLMYCIFLFVSFSMCAGCDLHPVQIGSEVLVRSRSGDSCTPACFQTRSVYAACWL